MKLAGQFLGIMASIVTMGAALLRLKWSRTRAAPGPTPVQTSTQKFLRIAAGIWLLVIVLAVTIVLIVTTLPAVIKLFQ